MNRINVIAALGLVALYLASYIILRWTDIIVRREWYFNYPYDKNSYRMIEGTDIGVGRRRNNELETVTIIYYPLWQIELRIRGKYYYHETIGEITK